MRKGSVITHDMNATNVAIGCFDDVLEMFDSWTVNSLGMLSEIRQILVFMCENYSKCTF